MVTQQPDRPMQQKAQLGDALAVIRRRLAGQGLTGPGGASPAATVSRLVAVQAQEYAEAKWSIGMRTRYCADADVETAVTDGELIRTHLLRPTWHFVVARDLRWLLRLTRPRVHRANASWYERSGLDPATLAHAHRVLADVLADGLPRTRRQLAERLAAVGIERAGLALGYLLMHAELEEVICSGPRHGTAASSRQHTYALLDLRVPARPDDERTPDDAADELVLRYFRSRGPATVADFSTWSGLTRATTRGALDRIGDALRAETDAAGALWYSDPQAPPAGVAASGCLLIPMYDELTIGYRQLRVLLAVPAPAGTLERPILHNGYTIGTWSRRVTRRTLALTTRLFTPLGGRQHDDLTAAADTFGRFLGLSDSTVIDQT